MSLAVATAAVDNKVSLLAVDNFMALAGRGVRGEIDGKLYHLGNHRLVEELELCSPELEEKLFALEEQGKTVILLCDGSGPMALFAVADTVKDSSRQAIRELHELGIKTLMLTGDNPHTPKVITWAWSVTGLMMRLPWHVPRSVLRWPPPEQTPPLRRPMSP